MNINSKPFHSHEISGLTDQISAKNYWNIDPKITQTRLKENAITRNSNQTKIIKGIAFCIDVTNDQVNSFLKSVGK